MQKSSYPAAVGVYCIEQHYTCHISCTLSKATAPVGQNTGQEGREGLFIRNSTAPLNKARWLCLSVWTLETANTVECPSGVYTVAPLCLALS